MNKGILIFLVSLSMLLIGAAVFMLALSAPTVSGPAFMRYVLAAWMIFALALLITSVFVTAIELKRKKKNK